MNAGDCGMITTGDRFGKELVASSCLLRQLSCESGLSCRGSTIMHVPPSADCLFGDQCATRPYSNFYY